MASSQDCYQTVICGGGWWNPGKSLFPPCSVPVSDFMWLDSSLNDMNVQTDQTKQVTSYSRSNDSSDDHHYTSSADDQNPFVISSDYSQTFLHVHKPHVTDFNVSDWSEYNSHDSSDMSIFRPVANDQKKYNSNIHDLYIQEQIIQPLTGPESRDMSYAFDSSFAPNWPLVSPSSKQQLNTILKYNNNNTNNSFPFWDSWMSNDETDTSHHELQPPVLVEDQNPSNYGNPSSEISLISPNKVGSKDVTAQKLGSNSTQLGTKRKNNTTITTTDELLCKRPRFETPSSLPTFKVRKEKLGDRITALQQLVSPFGKTDTASVLNEAIEYIKFLHDQVSVLRTSYMQNENLTSQFGLKNAGSEHHKNDLKSHGLCLVPITSTADFWTPTFGRGTM